MKVSVLILNWNGKKFLPECLGSLAAQTFRDFETVLVDNGSTDGSVEYVREAFPWVRLVTLAQNIGFAAGNDLGLETCAGEYIVTLNNDTRVDTGFLAALVVAADATPEIGMVAAKMLNYFDQERLDAVGLKIGMNGLGYNVGVGEIDAGRYDGLSEMFGPCGGAALYRRAMLDEVGFFDSDFFAYYEDFDLAWRGRLAGWRCVAAPRAVVYHVHSATGGEGSAFKIYHAHRNKWFTLIKNWPSPLLARHALSIAVADVGALLLAVLRGRGWAALRARIYVLLSLPLLLRKRRQVSKLRKITLREVGALFSAYEHPIRTFQRKIGRGIR